MNEKMSTTPSGMTQCWDAPSIGISVGNRAGQSNFTTRVRPRFLGPGRIQTPNAILELELDRIRSLASQLSVGSFSI